MECLSKVKTLKNSPTPRIFMNFNHNAGVQNPKPKRCTKRETGWGQAASIFEKIQYH